MLYNVHLYEIKANQLLGGRDHHLLVMEFITFKAILCTTFRN